MAVLGAFFFNKQQAANHTSAPDKVAQAARVGGGNPWGGGSGGDQGGGGNSRGGGSGGDVYTLSVLG